MAKLVRRKAILSLSEKESEYKELVWDVTIA
jgi:hypothetical protein